jgi:phosphoserine phosphatase
MTRIYLIRHGTTDWNKKEIFRGRIDCKLNEAGHAEAQALAAYFQGTDIAAIYSSPLSRASETAQAIGRPKSLSVISDDAFMDMDFGEWQGLALEEVKNKYPALYRTWREQPQDILFPNGESLVQVRTRCWEGLQRVARENLEKITLIVTHRVITKVLICAVLDLDNSHFWQIQQDTTAVNCIDYHNGNFYASLINDTCHLKTIRAGALQKDF